MRLGRLSLVAVTAFLAVGCASTVQTRSSADVGADVGEHTRTAGYEVAGPVRALVVTGETGDVRITGGSGTAVSVTETQHYRDAPPRTTHQLSGGTLTLAYDCDDCGVDYDVRVPAGTPVTVSDETGDITATGIASPRVRLTTGAGDVRAELASPPASLYAVAQTGDVALTVPGDTAYAVSAGTEVGRADVSVASDGGAAPAHTITARTETGDVSVRPRS